MMEDTTLGDRNVYPNDLRDVEMIGFGVDDEEA